MKKIKTLNIITRLNIGGPAAHSIILTEGLNKERFESLLVTGVADKFEGDMSFLAREKRIQPIVISQLKRNISFKDDVVAFLKIFNLIRKEKPHIVHTHMAKAGALGRLAAMLLRVPIKIHTFHGHVFHSYFNSPNTRLFLWIERFLARFTDKIITISHKQYEEIKNVFRVTSRENLEIIPLGFDLNPYLNSYHKRGCFKRMLGLPLDTVLVGIVGRLVSVKNHKLFLKAVHKINGEPAKKIKFVIVGDGELREELVNYTRQLRIEDRVIFAGWLKNLEEIYPDLDIITLTSLNEGTPFSLIEAMASGCTVIASDVGGVRDLVEDGTTGILFHKDDSSKLADGIIQLAQDTSMREVMGRGARNKVMEVYSKKRLMDDIEDLYERMIEKRRL